MRKAENDPEKMEICGKRIRECIDMCGITQKEVAEKLNYTEQYISLICRGKKPLTTELAIKMADYFIACMKGKTAKRSIDYMCLTKEELNAFVQQHSLYQDSDLEIVGHDTVRFYYDGPIEISYKYLLGETDDMCDDVPSTPSESKDMAFKEGVKEIMQSYGYYIDIGSCPNMFFDYMKTGNTSNLLEDDDSFYNFVHFFNCISGRELASRNTKISRESDEWELTPLETYILYDDIKKSIKNAVESALWRKEYSDLADSYLKKRNRLNEITTAAQVSQNVEAGTSCRRDPKE